MLATPATLNIYTKFVFLKLDLEDNEIIIKNLSESYKVLKLQGAVIISGFCN